MANYVLGGMGLISQTQGADTLYYVHDGQNSTRALVNGGGVITDIYTYNAFGEIYDVIGQTYNRYLYGSQQFDLTTGLYQLRARYYNPNTSLFVSRDLAQGNKFLPISFNKYNYASSNPINNWDPTGWQTESTLTNSFPFSLSAQQAATGVTVIAIAAQATCAALVILSATTSFLNGDPIFVDGVPDHCLANQMRLQFQGSGINDEWSRIATAMPDVGVSLVQMELLIDLLLIEIYAGNTWWPKKQASLVDAAIEKQRKYIYNIKNGGGIQGKTNKSEYIRGSQNRDRVDVENIRGHNLRQ